MFSRSFRNSDYQQCQIPPLSRNSNAEISKFTELLLQRNDSVTGSCPAEIGVLLSEDISTSIHLTTAALGDTIYLLPLAMAKHPLLVYLISIPIMFTCVRGCPFTGKSARALSAHQNKCEAHQRDIVHSARIRKSLAERSKQKKIMIQQQRNHPNETTEVFFIFICFRLELR